MAVAGTLEIQMLANMARLSEDMGKATRTVTTATKNIESAVASAKSALGALGIGISVIGFASLIRGSIDAMDKLGDLSKSTGLTVEQLAGLRVAAKQSGGDLDSIATSINKLSVEMGKAPEKFRALGISAKDPLEAFKQLSDIFVSIDNPQQRAALGAAALGKAWAGAAPLLAEGGEKIGEMVETGTRLSGVTSDMARQADELNDKLVLLVGTGGLLTRIVGPLLPLLNALADEMLKVSDHTLEATGSFNPFVEAMRSIAVLGSDVVFVFKGMGIEIGGIAAQLAAIGRGDFAGFSAISKAMKEDAARARAELDAFQKQLMEAGKKPLIPLDTPAVPVPGAGAKVGAFLGTGDDAAKAAAKAIKDAQASAKALRDLMNDSDERWLRDRDDTMAAMAAIRQADFDNAVAMGEQMRELFEADIERRLEDEIKVKDKQAADIKSLKESLMTETEIRLFAYEEDFNLLQKALDDKLIAQETYYTLLGRLVKRNEDEQARIIGGGYEARRKFAAMTMQQQVKDVFGYMADITAGVAQHNRALFEINKVAGIANAIVNAYEGISLTLAKYPYPLNIGLAALHAAAAFAQVSAIANTQFGSGGGAPSLAGGTAATPVTPVNDGTPQGSGQTTIVNFQGGTESERKLIRRFVEMLNENSRDGGRTIIA